MQAGSKQCPSFAMTSTHTSPASFPEHSMTPAHEEHTGRQALANRMLPGGGISCSQAPAMRLRETQCLDRETCFSLFLPLHATQFSFFEQRKLVSQAFYSLFFFFGRQAGKWADRKHGPAGMTQNGSLSPLLFFFVFFFLRLVILGDPCGWIVHFGIFETAAGLGDTPRFRPSAKAG